MENKLKTFWFKLSLFIKTGYLNPKYILLFSITVSNENNDDKDVKTLWEAATEFLHKGDVIYDELYYGIYELKVLRRAFNKERNSTNE